MNKILNLVLAARLLYFVIFVFRRALLGAINAGINYLRQIWVY